MKKVLILFAHPAFQKSRINKVLIHGLKDMEGVHFHDLYQHYPEMDIDIVKEQELLKAHDVIIFHHPFYWYSTPPILKEWQDLVLEHGWAYGSEGTALENKIFLNVITAGGGRAAYQKDGYNRFSMRQLLAPLEQTAYLCKMIFIPPFVVHETHSLTKEQAKNHKNIYLKLLDALKNDQIELEKVKTMDYMNDYFEEV